MNDYWVSYYVPTDRLGDFELHSPWWISGFTMDERERSTIVAAIRADSEGAAAQRFIDAFDDNPEAEERFVQTLDRPSPFTDRFPQSKWMAWDDTRTCRCDLPTCDGQDVEALT